MKNNANHFVVALLTLAFVLTLSGALINLHSAGFFSGNDFITTSAVSSGTGVSNLTINSATAITNNVAAINFGAGTVNATCSSCVMSSKSGNNPVCCLGFTNVTTGGFLLENTGNTNISVGYTCSGSCDDGSFIGGATNNAFLLHVVDRVADSAYYKVSETGTNDTAKSCVGGTSEGSGFNGWLARDSNQSNTTGGNGTVAISSTGAWLCGNSTTFPLQPDNTKDAGVVHLNITIDSAEGGSGIQKNVTFTFNATLSC